MVMMVTMCRGTVLNQWKMYYDDSRHRFQALNQMEDVL
jgi:hypothetical protein